MPETLDTEVRASNAQVARPVDVLAPERKAGRLRRRPGRRRARRARLALPQAVERSKIRWKPLISISLIHALALLALAPSLFSWSGVALAVAGVYVFGTLGINLGYHRLLTHRSFRSPVWLERTFVLLALGCLQGSPASWVAAHRMHHQHADEQPDPHSPLVAFLWGHIGWLFVENHSVCPKSAYERYARDVCRDPFYLWLERRSRWAAVYLVQSALFFLAGWGVGALLGLGNRGGAMFGASWLVWGVFVRTVVVWHITWSVNSFSHLFGYQSYETGENSRNNWLVGLLSNGEGWHNNHHADQRCAAHGRRWWEIDVSYYTILALKRLGLASAVVRPERATGHAPRRRG